MNDRLSPFFCYFGGKWRAAKSYPAPQFKTVIEPFAGSAGYALNYPDHQVQLFDLDPTICGIWDYLIHVEPSEILALPAEVAHVDDVKAPQAAKDLIGFWLNKGVATPVKTPSAWVRSGIRPNSSWGQEVKERIASQVQFIRHWTIANESYEKADNQPATWFVDPPYEQAGRKYRVKFSEFETLADWCRARQGQVIVCENVGATWLPFRPLSRIKATTKKNGQRYSAEAIWTNEISWFKFPYDE
jgi:site-specific DNA-adenine methylase